MFMQSAFANRLINQDFLGGGFYISCRVYHYIIEICCVSSTQSITIFGVCQDNYFGYDENNA
jgi:hypothetical protein